MRSIQRKFNGISKNNPHWGSYICFVEAVKRRRFDRRTIMKWFNKLVDKNDYDESEKKELIEYLSKVSNTPEEC